MKLLMLYGNPAAHYDDYRLFTSLGFEVASPFKHLGQPWLIHRPEIEEPEEFSYLQDIMRRIPGLREPREEYLQDKGLDEYGAPLALPPDFFAGFDVVVVLLVSNWVVRYWPSMTENSKRPLIIWRSGEGMPWQDYNLRFFRQRGLKVVRSSVTERTIPHNIGTDAVIRWSTDPNEWKGWDGTGKHVLVVSRCINRDNRQCEEVLQLADRFTVRVVGPGNDGDGRFYPVGQRTYNRLRRDYRKARVYFDANAKPAPYTGTFREAWMTGTPVVAVGPQRGGWRGLGTYELPELIEDGVNGFCSDDMGELESDISRLLDDQDLARRIGEAGRKRATEIFGREVVTEDWRRFFGRYLT